MKQSHPSRGAWIEMLYMLDTNPLKQSHPSRGAWIEMESEKHPQEVRQVAPFTGCVD